MRMSSLFLRTLRDDPADAEVESHKLLVRAGCIRRVSSGIYSWLPLGDRVLRNIAQIVREEMDVAGAQEVTFPILQPIELWEAVGAQRGLRTDDVPGRGPSGHWYAMAPTAEEVVTTLVAGEYSSYRDLPVNLYQINWKYRDELRPRFGVLRGREFLMKDAYSFDADLDGLQRSYDAMYEAYGKVFMRCGLTFRSVKASRARSVVTRARNSWPWPRWAKTRSSGASTATTPPTPRRRPGTRRRSRRCRTCRPARSCPLRTCPASTSSPTIWARPPTCS